MHPLYVAQSEPKVPVRGTGCALVAYWYTYASPRCRASQYRRTFILLSVSMWNDVAYLVFDGVGLAGFKSRDNAFYSRDRADSSISFLHLLFSLSLFSIYWQVLWGSGKLR